MNTTDTNKTPASRPWLTVTEAGHYMRTGRRLTYRAIKSGDLRHVRVGGRHEIRTRAEWCDLWLMGQEPTRG